MLLRIVMAAAARWQKLQQLLMEAQRAILLAVRVRLARRLGQSSGAALPLLLLQQRLQQRRPHRGSAAWKQRACSGSTGCYAAWWQLEQRPMQARDRWSSCLRWKLAEEPKPLLLQPLGKLLRLRLRYLQVVLGRQLLHRQRLHQQLQCLPSHSR